MSDDDSEDIGGSGDNSGDKAALRSLLKQLKADHRRIDDEIVAQREIGTVDMLKIGRMKKIKLILKDKIALIEDRLMPDIIA
ncbi:MAG: DUF465 domain-containing protein [Robiginitomaculum sp.]|nr:DUF465 domain-containing protein [Robiginitomaculum sp.]